MFIFLSFLFIYANLPHVPMFFWFSIWTHSKHVFHHHPPIYLPMLGVILLNYVCLTMLPLPPSCTEVFFAFSGNTSTLYQFQHCTG